MPTGTEETNVPSEVQLAESHRTPASISVGSDISTNKCLPSVRYPVPKRTPIQPLDQPEYTKRKREGEMFRKSGREETKRENPKLCIVVGRIWLLTVAPA